MRDHLSPSQRDLASYMSGISEEAYCAGWMHQVEFFLWRILNEGPCQFGALDITNEHIATLRSLSEACGGWIMWDDEIIDRKFVALSDWQQHFAAWGKSKRE